MYISTAYSNAKEDLIEERVYESLLSMVVEKKAILDIVPLDLVCNLIIVAVWFEFANP